MCFDPISMAMAGMSAAGGGSSMLGTLFSGGNGLLQAFTSYQQGKAQSEALKAEAARQDRAAREALSAGEEESDHRRRAGAEIAAQQKVAMAANGVSLAGPLAASIQYDSDLAVEQDAFSIRESAGRKARSYSEGAANSRTEADNAYSNGLFGAVSTVFSEGIQTGKKFQSYKRNYIASQGIY